MAKLDASVYLSILRVKAAYRFDIGAFIMRLYAYMCTIGTISMLTLAGYSSFFAGTVASVVAISGFLVAPQVSKRIDVHGQRAIVPFAVAIAMAGLSLLLASVVLDLPTPIFYVAAAIMGFNPSAPALARARWTYLVRTEQKGAGGLDLRSVFSYEGLIEDIGFTISPALSIALSAAVHPIAGMVLGGVCCIAGTAILISARESEPIPGWQPATRPDGETNGADGLSQPAESASATPSDEQADGSSPWERFPTRSVFRISPAVRILFTCTLLMGAFYGAFDSGIVVFCQSLGRATLASPAVAITGIISAGAGFVFGMLKLKSSPVRILLVTGALIGLGYFPFVFVCDAPSMFAMLVISSFTYAPFFITANTVCEHAVPGNRLTEGITWLNAGTTCGMAFGPTAAGWLMDACGPLCGFDFVGICALLIPVVIVIFLPVLHRHVHA